MALSKESTELPGVKDMKLCAMWGCQTAMFLVTETTLLLQLACCMTPGLYAVQAASCTHTHARTHAGDIRLQSDSSWVDRHEHLWGTHLISTLKMEEVCSKCWHQSTKPHNIVSCATRLKFYGTIKLASCYVVNSWKPWGNLYITLKCHALQKTFYITKSVIT
jgi:hypothetical protein